MPPVIRKRADNPLLKAFKNLINHGFENMGRYYSVYRGYVFNNQDPQGLCRLQLIIPTVTGPDFHETWAWPRNIPSDKNFGLKIVPPKGAVVWVEFEGGNPEVPIWSHGHFAENEIPTDDKELKDNDCYWFITKAGHKIKVNDTKKTIHIQSCNGDIVELNTKSISLVTNKAVSLGTLDGSKYHAVWGEPLKDLLGDIEYIIKTLHTALEQDKGPMMGVGIVNTPTAVTLPKLKTAVKGLKNKIDKILSSLVTLD